MKTTGVLSIRVEIRRKCKEPLTYFLEKDELGFTMKAIADQAPECRSSVLRNFTISERKAVAFLATLMLCEVSPSHLIDVFDDEFA